MLVEYSFKRSVSSWKALDIRKTLLMESCGRVILFFFSSRRRHTRWNCDWSRRVLFRSDEASPEPSQLTNRSRTLSCFPDLWADRAHHDEAAGTRTVLRAVWRGVSDSRVCPHPRAVPGQIGRASCRERGEVAGGRGTSVK